MSKKDTKEYMILIVMILTTLMGKMLGMVRDILIAGEYGITYEADAFFVASRIPNNFFDFALSAAVVSTFIPIFNRTLQRKGKDQAFEYANHFLTAAIAAAAVVGMVLAIFPGPVVNIFGPGLSEEAATLAAMLTRYMAPVVIFATITFTFVGLMQSHGKYVLPSAISIFSNAVVILYLIFLNPRYGLLGLAIAFTLGWAVQAIVQMPLMAKEGYRYKPTFNLKTTEMKDTLKMTGPVLLSTWAQPANTMIISILASFYMGGVSLMEYANRVYIIVSGVLIYTITNYVFPKLSKTFSQKDREGFGFVIERSLELFLYFGIPVVFIVMLFSQEMIRILFERGAFDAEATAASGAILMFFIWGLIGLGLKEILNRVYFAMGNSKIPLLMTLIGILTNIPLSIVLSKYMGLVGLALGSTLAMTLSALVMVVLAIRGGLIDNWSRFVKIFIKVLTVDLTLFLGIHLTVGSLQTSILWMLVQIAGLSLVYLFAHVFGLKLLKVGIPTIQMEKY